MTYAVAVCMTILNGLAEEPKTAAEAALKKIEKEDEDEEAAKEAEETNLRVTGKSIKAKRVDSAKAARQARRAREKAKSETYCTNNLNLGHQTVINTVLYNLGNIAAL